MVGEFIGGKYNFRFRIPENIVPKTPNFLQKQAENSEKVPHL